MIFRIQHFIARIELAVIAASLLVMLACVCSNVLDRAFNSPLPDLTEFALVAMAFLGFIGSSYATYARQHITLDLLDLLAEGHRRIAGRLIDVVIAVFGIIFAVISWQFLGFTLMSHEKLLHFGTPVAVPVGSMFVGCVLMAFHALCNLAAPFFGPSEAVVVPVPALGQEY